MVKITKKIEISELELEEYKNLKNRFNEELKKVSKDERELIIWYTIIIVISFIALFVLISKLLSCGCL